MYAIETQGNFYDVTITKEVANNIRLPKYTASHAFVTKVGLFKDNFEVLDNLYLQQMKNIMKHYQKYCEILVS